MSVRARFAALLGATAVLVAASAAPVPAVATAGAGAPQAVTARAAEKATAGAQQRTVTVEWKGSPRPSRYSKRLALPGVGGVRMTCRPNLTQISIEAGNRANETQMWLAKYEDKSYGRAVAVKTVRVYRYAHAGDDGTGGTGNPQHEGLNQGRGKHGVENYAKGYAYGIISQRPGRNQPAGGAPLDPVTTFNLTWYWNGFDYPAKYRYCKVQATFLTRPGSRIGLNWHGDDDAEGHERQEVGIGNLGTVALRCQPGRFGARTISLVTDRRRSNWYAEVIEGEGRVEDHVDVRRRERDPETGRVGPMELPRNGMSRVFFDNGNTKVPYLLSSYQVTNNPRDRLNVCELAMGQLPR